MTDAQPIDNCAVGVLVRDGRVLIGLRGPHRRLYPDKWDFFGGHCEPGESVEDTLVRELNEELAVTPTAYSPLVVLDDKDPGPRGERRDHLFLVTDWQGPGPRINDEEHTEIGWFTRAEALDLDLAIDRYREVLHLALGD